MCSLETFNAAKDPYRVTPRGHLPVQSLKRLKSCSERLSIFFPAIEPTCREILQHHQINILDVLPYAVQTNSINSFPTYSDILLIRTLDTLPQKWEDAADDLRKLFLEAAFDIKIEIQNEKRAYLCRAPQLPYNTRLKEMVKQIHQGISEKIKELFGYISPSIAWEMQGHKDDLVTRRFTCVVGCVPGTRLPFKRIEDQLRSALDAAKSPDVTLYLEILPVDNL